MLHAGAKITYTYDVLWEESNIAWSSRWDAYLKMPGGKVSCCFLCSHLSDIQYHRLNSCFSFAHLKMAGGKVSCHTLCSDLPHAHYHRINSCLGCA